MCTILMQSSQQSMQPARHERKELAVKEEHTLAHAWHALIHLVPDACNTSSRECPQLCPKAIAVVPWHHDVNNKKNAFVFQQHVEHSETLTVTGCSLYMSSCHCEECTYNNQHDLDHPISDEPCTCHWLCVSQPANQGLHTSG